jgi:hypothetical protein
MVIPVEEIFGSISFPWWAMALLMVFVFIPGAIGVILYAIYWMLWYYLPSIWRIVVRPDDGFVYQIKSGVEGDESEGRHRYWLLCYAGWKFNEETGDIVPGKDKNQGGIWNKGIYMIGFFEFVAKIRQKWAEVKDGHYIPRAVVNRGLLVKKAPMAYMADVMDEDNFPFRFLGTVIWRMCNPDKASRFTHEAREIIIGLIGSAWVAWAKEEGRKIYRPSVDISKTDQCVDINIKVNPSEEDSDQIIEEFWSDLTKQTYKYRPFIVRPVEAVQKDAWPIALLTSRLPYYKGISFDYDEGDEKEGSFLEMVREVYGFEIERMTLDNVILDEKFAEVISEAIRAKMLGAARLIKAYFDKEARLQSQEPAEKMGAIFDKSPGAAYWELVSALAQNMPASLLDLSAIGTLVNGVVPPGVPATVKEGLVSDIVRARQTIKK